MCTCNMHAYVFCSVQCAVGEEHTCSCNNTHVDVRQPSKESYHLLTCWGRVSLVTSVTPDTVSPGCLALVQSGSSSCLLLPSARRSAERAVTHRVGTTSCFYMCSGRTQAITSAHEALRPLSHLPPPPNSLVQFPHQATT